ncbi:EboA domain-containing protein [Streptomyces ovatisporus]|uniref:EboA domain-containing protein n=1 Tax=Streptomyces ovatisporus TaxID=1128682 RepID=A0ABV9AB06_9ACTN
MLSPAEQGRDPLSPAEIRARVETRLDDAALAWLGRALADAAASAAPRDADAGPAAWEGHFAAAGRHCGRRAACDVRVLLLHAARADTPTLTRLYQQGTTAERTAVLCALPHLPAGGADECVRLVEDALRANDTGLVAAAVGPYAAAHLDPHGWRHAVLKCLFTGVPLAAVAGLGDRARGDADLARMLRDFAHERTAAGRSVPGDLHLVLALAEAPSEAPAEPPSGVRGDAPSGAAPHPPEDPPEEF